MLSEAALYLMMHSLLQAILIRQMMRTKQLKRLRIFRYDIDIRETLQEIRSWLEINLLKTYYEIESEAELFSSLSNKEFGWRENMFRSESNVELNSLASLKIVPPWKIGFKLGVQRFLYKKFRTALLHWQEVL